MIGTLVLCAVSWGVGVYHGVCLREKELVTSQDIHNCGELVIKRARVVVAKIRKDPVCCPPPDPTFPTP